MELSLSDRPVDLIEDGFDLAIRGGNIGDGAGLMTRTIGLQRMAICVAPTYLAKHGRPERLDDLLRHTGIVYARAGHIRTWEFPAGERKALVEATPPSRLRFGDAEAIADAAEAGHGLAWLPCGMAMTLDVDVAWYRESAHLAFDGTARLWDAATGKQIAALEGHTKWVHSAAFSPLASGS